MLLRDLLSLWVVFLEVAAENDALSHLIHADSDCVRCKTIRGRTAQSAMSHTFCGSVSILQPRFFELLARHPVTFMGCDNGGMNCRGIPSLQWCLSWLMVRERKLCSRS